MKAWQQYFEIMQGVVAKAYKTQGENLEKAAGLLTECTRSGGLIHAFGTGHSSLITEDVFWRAATIANVHAIFEPSVAGITEITKTSHMEKLEGMGKVIVEYNRIAKPDVLIAISNSGNNAVTIDMAIECRKLGVPVIAITNVEYSDFLKQHHSTGKSSRTLQTL